MAGGSELFDLWLKACKELGTKVYKLEPGFYQTWSEYELNHSFYRSTPVYHVWDDGRQVYCGLSYTEGYAEWERRKRSSKAMT